MNKVIGFHNPDERYGFLSNWYPSAFEKDGVRYSSMEQYMMHRKALVMGDTEIAGQILSISDAGKIKALGKAVRNYNDTLWNGVRQVIIYEGLLEKFRQNEELKEQLLATGECILAECAVQDRIWGIGLSMQDERQHDMSLWRGQNLLGFALMLVRSALR